MKRSRISPRLLLFLILLVFTGLFVYQNTEVVQITFLFWSVEASRVVIYLTIFLSGMLSCWLGLGRSFRRLLQRH